MLTDQLDKLASWPAGLRDPPVSAFLSRAIGKNKNEEMKSC